MECASLSRRLLPTFRRLETRLAMGRRFGVIIGMRQLSQDGALRKPISVALGKPRRMKGGDWECPFRITGFGIQYGYGVDSIQALTTALEGIRVTLRRSGKRLTWVGGDSGDTGFERLVTTSFGVKFTERLDHMIDREIARFVQALKRQHQRHSAKSAGKARREKRTMKRYPVRLSAENPV